MVACRSWTLARSTRGLEADLVGLAVMDAALDAAAGEPGGEGVRVVVAAHLLRVLRPLRHRQPAELAAPDDQRRVEQAALLQVGQQGGDGLIGLAGELAMVAGDVGVAVPAPLVLHAAASRSARSGRRAPPAAGPSDTAGEVAAAADCRGRRGSAIGSRFAVDVERFRGGHLHAVGQLEALDAGGQLRLGRRVAAECSLVEPAQQVELPPLLAGVDRAVGQRGCRWAHPAG